MLSCSSALPGARTQVELDTQDPHVERENQLQLPQESPDLLTYTCSVWTQRHKCKAVRMGTGEMAQWLRALAALPEDSGSIPQHPYPHGHSQPSA